MSWLEDYDIEYQYRCTENHVTSLVLPSKETAPPNKQCEHCLGIAGYIGFKPNKVKQTTKVEYDKNGFKAVETTHPDGTKTYMSKTKEKYLKTGRIEHEITPAYREHLRKEEQEHLYQQEAVNKRRAKVTHLKDLPDGEYVSDGTNVVPVKN